MLAEIQKKNEPYHFDLLFVFFMMLSNAINEEAGDLEEEEEDKEPSHSSEEKERKPTRVELEEVGSLIALVNTFILQYVPRYRRELELEKVPLFQDKNIARLI